MSGALSTFASGFISFSAFYNFTMLTPFSVSVTMVSRLMFNLREKVTDAGIHTTTNIASTPVEFLSPSTEIELDTIWSGDMQHCTIPSVRSLGPVDEDDTNIDLAPSWPLQKTRTLTAIWWLRDYFWYFWVLVYMLQSSPEVYFYIGLQPRTTIVTPHGIKTSRSDQCFGAMESVRLQLSSSVTTYTRCPIQLGIIVER